MAKHEQTFFLLTMNLKLNKFIININLWILIKIEQEE